MSEYIVKCKELVGVSGSVIQVPDYIDTEHEIVRCMDCEWFTNSSHYGAYCTNFGAPLHDDYDGYCAWGERKEGGE